MKIREDKSVFFYCFIFHITWMRNTIKMISDKKTFLKRLTRCPLFIYFLFFCVSFFIHFSFTLLWIFLQESTVGKQEKYTVIDTGCCFPFNGTEPRKEWKGKNWTPVLKQTLIEFSWPGPLKLRNYSSLSKLFLF